MAYQIRYENATVVRESKSQQKKISGWIAALCAIVLLVSLLQLESVQNFLIPGEPEVTKEAFSAFTQDLEEGESFADAAAAFCRQIIQYDVLEQ